MSIVEPGIALPPPSAELFARVILGRLRLELEAHEPLLAKDPGVVTRLDDIRIPGAELELRAVLVRHVHPAGLDDADVPGLAAIGARDRLDALGPLPAGLERETGGRGAAAEPHDVDLGLFGSPRLVRRLEIPGLDTSHASLLLVSITRKHPSSTTGASDGKAANEGKIAAEENAVTRSDDLDWPALTPAQADALGDEARLGWLS